MRVFSYNRQHLGWFPRRFGRYNLPRSQQLFFHVLTTNWWFQPNCKILVKFYHFTNFRCVNVEKTFETTTTLEPLDNFPPHPPLLHLAPVKQPTHPVAKEHKRPPQPLAHRHTSGATASVVFPQDGMPFWSLQLGSVWTCTEVVFRSSNFRHCPSKMEWDLTNGPLSKLQSSCWIFRLRGRFSGSCWGFLGHWIFRGKSDSSGNSQKASDHEIKSFKPKNRWSLLGNLTLAGWWFGDLRRFHEGNCNFPIKYVQCYQIIVRFWFFFPVCLVLNRVWL